MAMRAGSLARQRVPAGAAEAIAGIDPGATARAGPSGRLSRRDNDNRLRSSRGHRARRTTAGLDSRFERVALRVFDAVGMRRRLGDAPSGGDHGLPRIFDRRHRSRRLNGFNFVEAPQDGGPA